MLNIYRRAADDRDIDDVSRGKGSQARNLVTVSLPVAVLAGALVYAKWRSLTAAGLVGGGLFVASLASNVRFFVDVQRRERLKSDANAVEVFEVSASSVVDLEPLGDNAPAFCFFAGNGKALLLVGQWLLQYDSFPAESFRLHRWASTKKPIRIEVTGRPVDAETSTVCLRPTYQFGEIEMLDARRETLQNDLDRVLGRRVSR